MITLYDDFEIERDTYGWSMTHWKDGEDKDGNPKRQKRITYHATFPQICRAIMDVKAGDCETVKELIDLFSSASEVLAKLEPVD